MDNYPSYSYPDSGDSSPRSREIDFENPPPSWEEQQPQPPLNHKVKFMVSYGGKIQPRSHDNLLSYVGGETKILSLDRNIKFNSLFSKLSSIVSPDSEVVSGFTFKYQLPGEELDALISVTNDDDLENMMHEYDRLYRGSSKPARLRLFLFPVGSKSGSFGSTCSDPGKIERDSDRFVEALNSGHTVHPPSQPQVVTPPPPLPQVTNNVDLLFGLEKQHQQIPHPHHHPVQVSVPLQVSDPQIDARIQDLNRMHISVPKHEPDPNVFTGAPATIPASVQVPAQYWQPPPPPVNVEQQPPPPQPHHHHQFHHQHPPPQQQHQQLQPQQQQHQQPPPPQQQQQHHPQQAVYMMHPGPPPPQQGNMMHAPSQMMRPPPTQGYYQVRVPEQQQQQPPPPPQQQQQQQPVYNMNPGNMGGYSESMGLPVRPVPGMAQDNQQGYTQVAYDNGSGRQVYYAAQQQQQQGSGGGSGGGGVVTTSYQGAAVSGGDMRNMAAESKVVQKVVPTSNSAV